MISNNNSAIIQLEASSGIGDRLLDFLGFHIICQCLGYKSHVILNGGRMHAAWGITNYDTRLFDLIEDETLAWVKNSDNCPFYVYSPNPSSSLCPYKVYEFVQSVAPGLKSFEEIGALYIFFAKSIIRPSAIIKSGIPDNIQQAYGIHLRKTDKVHYESNGHQSLMSEFEIIMQKLWEDVERIIREECEPFFFVCSEDVSWKNEFTNRILEYAQTNEKHSHIMVTSPICNAEEYENYTSVLDMFCLSQCKMILQGVKHSSFSMVASIIGPGKLTNYCKYLNCENRFNTNAYFWNSVVEINNKTILDVEIHRNFVNCQHLQTNISHISLQV